MIHEVTATGLNVDEARVNAIAQLNAPADADVKIDIVSMGKKKTFGLFGGEPAKVRVSYDDGKAEVKPAPVKAQAPAKQEVKPAQEKKAKPAYDKKADKPKFTKKVEAAPAVSNSEVKEELSEERVEIDPSSNEVAQVCVNYLEKVLNAMGISDFSAKVYSIAKTSEIIIHINCTDDYGILIGRRGETLDSLQFLTRLAAKKSAAEGDYTRVSVNIGNYREKRNVTLKELARKNAEKVLKYGRNMTFEPMNPYERRVIHTAIQEIEGVVSFSVGSDAARKVVISLAEGVKPTHARSGGNGYKGGYKGNNPRNNNNRRPYNNNNRPRNNAPRNEQTAAPAAREPRTDASAEKFARYGKIN